MGSRHKSIHLLSLQSWTGILSILLGQKTKNSTTKLVASSSVCSKDYPPSASSSRKSHSNPFYLMHIQRDAQKHVVEVKDAREISVSQQYIQYLKRVYFRVKESQTKDSSGSKKKHSDFWQKQSARDQGTLLKSMQVF